MQRTYLAIDLKSYYASAECASRHLDPLTTNLVVADSSRTEKTICLAVSPSLKAYGIPGRARLFEVVQKVKEVNANRLREAVRLRKAMYKDGKPSFSSASYDSLSLAADPSLELSYLVAPPRMAYYEKVSRQIYGIYLKYIAPEDIVVYSIDEVFIDATSYLSHYMRCWVSRRSSAKVSPLELPADDDIHLLEEVKAQEVREFKKKYGLL